MPKIVIKEYDKTKAIANEYANFAIVVPGPVDTTKDLSFFDDNGIYECSSQADFVKKIGLLANVAAKEEAIQGTETDPVPAEPSLVKRITPEEDSSIPSGYYKIASGVAVYTKSSKAGAVKAGKLIDAQGYIYTPAFKSDGFGLFDAGADSEIYYTFEEGKEGADAVPAKKKVTQMFMGNQIAYELLGLGYTVFYKKYSALSELATPTFWEALKDKTNYDFRYIMTGYLSGSEATENIINVAKERGDCIALLDIDSSAYKGEYTRDTKIANIIENAKGYAADKNCAIFLPTVVYDLNRSEAYETAFSNDANSNGASSNDASSNDASSNKNFNKRFPASFHYLTCVANASERYAEWYAASGFTRGVSPFGITTTDFTIGEAIIDKLQPRKQVGGLTHAVNVIAKFRDQYLLWGNRTANPLRAGDDADLIASDFLNIRQLCCTLKKQIYVACRQLTFDPNSEMLWINFKNKIRPILEKMKADQGIQDYEFVKIANAPKATLKAQIRIVPIEAVEDFEIDVMLEDSLDGVVIGETDAE